MKKAIAMRCTQEQFEAIKPKLKGFAISSLDEFYNFPYLTNFFCDVWEISNFNQRQNGLKTKWECLETWDEKAFLEACGISTIPTLEEVKEYFENAEIVKSEYNNTFDIGEIKECDAFGFLAYKKDNNREQHTVWSKEKGYAEIITYKEKTYSLTKDQLRSLTDPQVKEWFPEVFETVFQKGKWAEIVPTKTKAEAEKELNCKIVD